MYNYLPVFLQQKLVAGFEPRTSCQATSVRWLHIWDGFFSMRQFYGALHVGLDSFSSPAPHLSHCTEVRFALFLSRGYTTMPSINPPKMKLANPTSMHHYHLQVEPNPKKNCTIKPILFSVSMGKTGLTHDIFFEFSLGPFEVVEAEGGRLVKEADFEAEIFFY